MATPATPEEERKHYKRLGNLLLILSIKNMLRMIYRLSQNNLTIMIKVHTHLTLNKENL